VEAAVAVLVEGVVDSQAEDLHSVEAEASIEVEIDQCLRLLVAIAEKNVKCLSDQQTANRFTAVSVLKKWEAADLMLQDKKEAILEPQVLTKNLSLMR
jgi:hypothetical protein